MQNPQYHKILKCEHLYQMYPQMPQYAADPQQSPFIRTYDNIMGRFQGHYGKQPTYFIRSPATITLMGDAHQYVGFTQLGVASLQNVIIAISRNTCEKIRVNNYQKAIYGQQIYPCNLNQWKFDKNSDDQYLNLVVGTIKVSLTSDKNYESKIGLDILIYCDFMSQQFLGWRNCLIFSINTAIQTINKSNNPNKQIDIESVEAISRKVHNLYGFTYLSTNSTKFEYNKISIIPGQQTISFPSKLSLVIAHSLTPLPKKLVEGKRFNLRRCEILIGIQIIKYQLGITKQINSLRQLQQNLTCNVEQLIETVEDVLPKDQLNAQQIQQLTEKTLIQILKEVPYANSVIDQNHYFHPYPRIQYFLKEALLTQSIYKFHNNSENQTSPQHQIQWEQLFIDSIKQSSQNSKTLLNERSEQINQILSVTSGLYKCFRILGNGWGGNVIFICDKNNASKIVDTLINQFYLKSQNKVLISDDLDIYVKDIGKPSTPMMILNPDSQIWY